MLTMTEAAGQFLSVLLEKEECSEEIAVRLIIQEEEIVIVPDSVRDGDTVLSHDGRVVLMMEESVSELLADQTLGIVASDESTMLSLEPTEDEG